MKCPEPCVRQERLDEQISSLLQNVSLPTHWAENLTTRLEQDESKSAQAVSVFIQTNQERITAITTKLQRLLDGYLEQDIDREIYRIEKAKLLSEKKSLEEQMTNLIQKQNGWLEPMKEWIQAASSLENTAKDDNLIEKKVAAKEIFGSNLLLSAKQVSVSSSRNGTDVPQNQWTALLAAHESVGKKSQSIITERVAGIEPASGLWKSPIIATILYPRLCICTQKISIKQDKPKNVGALGIEPSLYGPKPYVLPVYDAPSWHSL